MRRVHALEPNACVAPKDVVVDLLLSIRPNPRPIAMDMSFTSVVGNRVVIIMGIIGCRSAQHWRIAIVVDDDIVVETPHAFPTEVGRAAVVAVDVVVIDLWPRSRQRQFANVHIECSAVMPRVVVKLAVAHREMS